ncbi:TonB-dependent receptor [Dechloromonas denitrificans]|uniref:TonB-dependent receptor n=1 Tax=Dechloromonas denitrificans TaxID=281362 RepID=UPI001CF7FCA5|nr:TonB-dependent receptor [Dechloromonas denitrificans]UCV12803.1 TonB-dependent receptor [Dechloromonas denitrificans]
MRQHHKPTLLALALSAAFGHAGAVDREIQAETVEVVGSTPLSGVGVPRLHLPANVQSISASQMEEQESLNLPEAMLRQLPSVNLNEIQGNPFQADLNYRGFTASPLLGTAQGLSVYLDGVRINEPFGDTVNWDLLPHSAIAGMDLMPGSNPVFGLNTLGGALAIRTKSGFSHPGSKLELSGGSFGRRNVEIEHGGNAGSLGWYVAADWFKEDGWRDYSKSEAKQFFGKLSHKSAAGEADLTLSRAVTKMTGNGLLPLSMFAERRDQIFTHPDQTRNDMTQLALSGRLWLNDSQSLSGNVYHRRSTTRTLNGDVNDEFEDGVFDGVSNQESGANNRTRTRQQGSGLGVQWNLNSARHQLTLGTSFDYARMNFRQTQQLGLIDATRGIADPASEQEQNRLRGTTRTASLFATDTYALLPNLHLTGSARYNMSRVTTFDELDRSAPNLDGDHSYRKLNPALGLSWQIVPALNAYAGFSQGNRVPTPIELGCADPANPCTLPNSMAADPYLKQVVTQTVEAGLRGKLVGDIGWNAGVYRSVSSDDIIFVGTSTSAGYFTNFGKTQRQGLELGLNGRQNRVDWFANYSYLHATFQSGACLLAENNSTRGTAPECTAGGQDDEIRVRKGDRLPGLPTHSAKLGLNWRATDWLRLGGDVQAFSGQYARGNENNQHQSGTFTDALGNTRTFDGPGKTAGYAILNLNGEARLGGGWQMFAKVNNVFDKRYATAAALAENPFAGGSFQIDSGNWRRETFVAPGAPRAAWIGLRYAFGN